MAARGEWSVLPQLLVLVLVLVLVLFQPLVSHAEGEGNAEGLGSDMCPECGLHVDPSVAQSSREADHQQQKLSTDNQQQKQLDRIEGMLRQVQESVKSLHDRLDASSLAETVTTDKATKGRVLARRKPAWAEHIEFLSAARVDAPVSSIHILPQEGKDGLNKFVAVGDEVGHLYVFSISGELLVDQQLDAGAVTAMVTVSLRRNETLLVTGHSSGAVLAHRIWETGSTHDAGSLRLEHSHDFVAAAAAKNREELSRPVWSLEMYRIGRARYLLVADDVGTLRLYRDNGTLHGSAVASSKPLVYLRTPSVQRVIFLSSHEATSLDLRTMKMKSSPCKGLDKSSIVAYTFDPVSRSKLYGVTDNGDLVYALVASDASHCLLRPKRKLELQGGPFKMHGLRGYVIIATPRELSVLNTTHQRVQGLRTLFTATMDEISQSFVASPLAMPDQPLLACDRDRVIALGFGDGYLGFFKSNLPVQATADWIGPRLGGVPVFFTILLLALAWYQFSKRKAAAAAAPMLQDHDPATATTTSLSSPFLRGRATEIVGGAKARDKSEVGLEELPRRYRSPARAATGFGSSSLNYRTNTTAVVTSLRNSTT